MKGDKIPDRHNIARYCRPTHAPGGQIQATAFMLRAGEESLSVNWLEFLNCLSRDSEIAALRNIYSAKLGVGAHARVDTHGLTPVALAAEDHFISFEGFRTLKLPRKERFHLRAHARSPQLILDRCLKRWGSP
jgi:hypothetical protein